MKTEQKFWIIATVIFLTNVIVYILNQFLSFPEYVFLVLSDLFPIICSFIAVIGLYKATRQFKIFDIAKKSWFMISSGILLYFLGEFTYGFMEVALRCNMEEIIPSLADFFWILGYLPLGIGLYLLLIGYKQSGYCFGNCKKYLLYGAGLAIVVWLMFNNLLLPIVQDKESTLLEKTVYLFYPIGDLFLILPAILLGHVTYQLGKGALSKPWKYMAMGFILFTTADILYSDLSWHGFYATGNFIDIFWNSGYLLLAAAGFAQHDLMQSVQGMKYDPK